MRIPILVAFVALALAGCNANQDDSLSGPMSSMMPHDEYEFCVEPSAPDIKSSSYFAGGHSGLGSIVYPGPSALASSTALSVLSYFVRHSIKRSVLHAMASSPPNISP